MNQVLDFGSGSVMSPNNDAGTVLLFASAGALTDVGVVPGPLAVADATRFIELFEMQVGDAPAALGFAAEIASGPNPLEAVRLRMFELIRDGQTALLCGEDRLLTDRCCCANLVALWGKAGRMEADEAALFTRQRTVMAGLRAATGAAFQAVPATTTLMTADALIHRPEAFVELLAMERAPVYLSIDVDVLSPGSAQCGRSVEPGGLSWYDLMRAVDAVFAGPGILAAEIVGAAGIAPRSTTALICAQLMLRMAGLTARGKNPS